MNFTLYDDYNLRSRISVCVMLMAPIMIPLYLMNEDIRSLSTTALILVTVISLLNLFMIQVRKLAKDTYDIKEDVVMKYYNVSLKKEMKDRVIQKIEKIDPQIGSALRDPEHSADVLGSAVRIMKESVRSNKLVREENIQYGFVRNAYGARAWGILISVVMVCCDYLLYVHFEIDPVSFALSVFADVIFVVLWCVCAQKELVEFTAKNYAEALLDAFAGQKDEQASSKNTQKEVSSV